MRSLAGSLADGVLADTILIPPRPSLKGLDFTISQKNNY